MPRPTTKEELLAQSQANFQKLISIIDSFSEDQLNQQFAKGTLNRNVRDVLWHLHQWHLFLLDWYKIGMKGGKPDMPAKGYNWQTLPALNKKIWKDSQNIEVKEALKQLKRSYKKVQKLINAHTNAELFEKKRYDWTGSTSLGVYLISNTSSHYNWGIKLIKKHIRS